MVDSKQPVCIRLMFYGVLKGKKSSVQWSGPNNECLTKELIIAVFFSMQQANIGQDEDFESARKKAESLGAKKVRAMWNRKRQVCPTKRPHLLCFM